MKVVVLYMVSIFGVMLSETNDDNGDNGETAIKSIEQKQFSNKIQKTILAYFVIFSLQNCFQNYCRIESEHK